MSDDSTPSGPPSKPARPGRRLALELLLLIVLIAALAMKPGWRSEAGATVQRAAHWLTYDALGLSAREVYEWRLRIAGLADTPAVTQWRDAPETADEKTIRRSYAGPLVFSPDTIRAAVYRLSVRRGEALVWRIDADETNTARRLFATLEYRKSDQADWHTEATLRADGETHRRRIDTDGQYRFVLQPGLFEGFDGRIAFARGGALGMPVVGAHARDIGGGFGAPRDGGARRHHGVDIFADAGTPVRAVVAGRVSHREGGLGGKTIFLSDGWTGPRYYYAHLSSYVVPDGAQVAKGEVIGRVGNTGNAAGGPPHLHFGIYARGGPIDPAAFIEPEPVLPD